VTLQPPVMGADRLFIDHQELILDKRVALLTNHSGVLADGTHLADAIDEHPRARLSVLFGMHHDIRSNDDSVPRDPEQTVDRRTGAPKFDLYATNHKPTTAILRDSDVILVDVQDAGARFYEHVNVMGFMLEAAAERGIDVVVLDRPNPIAPMAPDGFVPDAGCLYQFGSYGPIPVTHGMTMGELAMFYVGERLLRSETIPTLHVVRMLDWSRSNWFDDLGPFRPPSPNLVRMSSVVSYPGFGLFEAFNVSEGRGTDFPFEQIGSPWMDADQVADVCDGLGLPGVSFRPVSFIPTKQPFHGAAPHFADQLINGVRVSFADRMTSMPVRAAIALWWAIRIVHPDALEVNHPTYIRLAATQRARTLIDGGASPHDVFEAWRTEVAVFLEKRGEYLLYD
jgi:uncharacterized protein YbbC (DUF1343 family)